MKETFDIERIYDAYAPRLYRISLRIVGDEAEAEEIMHDTLLKLYEFRRKDEILDLVSQSDSDDINVLIGSESPVKVMNNSAMVFKPITNNGKVVGVIGILGPRRMDYKKVLQTIEEIGAGISGMIDGEHALKPPNTDGGKENG